MHLFGKPLSAIVVAIVALGTAPLAFADLDLGIIDTGGTGSYTGGNSPLQGDLAESTGFCIDPCTGPEVVIVGSFPYATGQFLNNDATDWFFAPGGFLTMTGFVIDRSTNNVLLPEGNVMTGTFIGDAVLSCGGTFGSPTCDPQGAVGYNFRAGILATLNPNFANLLSLPNVPYSGTLSFFTGTHAPLGQPWGPPSPVSFGQDVDLLTIDLAPVPEPGSVSLLLTAVAIWGARIGVRRTRVGRTTLFSSSAMSSGRGCPDRLWEEIEVTKPMKAAAAREARKPA